jgi:excisionase family DNA binding protein
MNRAIALSGQALDRSDVIVAIEPRLLGVEVAALVYDISADTIAELQDAGELPVLRIGRRRLVPVRAMDAWIDAQLADPAA